MLFTSIILVSLIACVLVLNHWSQNKGIIYLVLVILIVSARQLSWLLAHTPQHTKILTGIVIHIDPLFALNGTLIFYYFKSLVKGKLVVDKYLFILLIPFFIVLLNTLPYYVHPWASKLAYFEQVQTHIPYNVESDFPSLFVSYDIQRTFLVIYNLGVFLYSMRYLFKLKKSSSIYLKKKVTILINHLLVVVPLIILPNWIGIIYATLHSNLKDGLAFRNSAFASEGYLFFIVLILPVSFFFLPNWLYNDQNNGNLIDRIMLFFKRASSSSSGFRQTTFEKSDDLERILNYIENESPHLAYNFSLHDISRALNIPHMRVTNCFNQQLKITFPTYRNKLRVAHSIELIKKGEHLTTSIEGIAAKSGFKSKSIFYSAFRADYGMTPIDWIKVNL
jgi:AraC-like DNA-binding protein